MCNHSPWATLRSWLLSRFTSPTLIGRTRLQTNIVAGAHLSVLADCMSRRYLGKQPCTRTAFFLAQENRLFQTFSATFVQANRGGSTPRRQAAPWSVFHQSAAISFAVRLTSFPTRSW